jgi:hypothetical protein
MNLFLLLSLILIPSIDIYESVYIPPTEGYSQIQLDATIGITLFWHANFDNQSVELDVEFGSNNDEKDDFRWLAIGFSDYGELSEADLCFMWFDKEEKVHFQVIVMIIQDILIIF